MPRPSLHAAVAGAHREGRDRSRQSVITHRMPLADAAKGYDIFLNKEDNCEKVVLST